MKLERDTEKGGRFSIIDHRTGKVVHNGDPHDDFFVLKLKDWHAAAALRAYALSAQQCGDHDLSNDVLELAQIANYHPDRKMPD